MYYAHTPKTAQTLGSYVEVKKVDDKLELLSAEEKEAYEKKLLEELEEERKREEEAQEKLKLEVLVEQEYDPLTVENHDEEDPIPVVKTGDVEEEEEQTKQKGEKQDEKEELLYLLRFLKFLDVPTIRSPGWKKDITEKQERFIETLCHRCFDNDPPELINEISCHQASLLISSLLEKDGGQLKATNRQIKTLIGMGLKKDEAEALNFKEASSILWEVRQIKRSENLCTA